MRAIRCAIIIAPIGGSGVFRHEARRLAALYDVPDGRVVLFDQRLPPAERFRSVCNAIGKIVDGLGPDDLIDAVVVLCHGWKTGDQIGATIHNLGIMFAAFRGRLSTHVVVSFNSCSNGADTSAGPGGDGSFADAARDTLCRMGLVWCRATGHLAPGHATMYPFVRFFDGDGSIAGGIGGYGIVQKGDPLFPIWRAELRKAVDPDGPGPEPMTSLRWTYWTMDRAEILARLRALDQLCHECGREEPPTVLELQQALVRLGFDPGELDGVAGRRTTAAVKAFQRQHPPLRVDGDAGPKTWAVLRAEGVL